MAIIVGLVILGGIKSIATTTAAIVPFMCGIYMAAGLIVILTNIGQLGEAFGLIFKGAFDDRACDRDGGDLQRTWTGRG